MPTLEKPQEVQQSPKYPSDEMVAEWRREFYHTDGRESYDAEACIDFQMRKACDWQARECREQVARWMLSRGFATGHGDTIEDLLTELVSEVRSRDALGRSGETK